MVRKTVSFSGSAHQQARAREALLSLSGVVAAELVPGRCAVRVWQGDELDDSALLRAIGSVGVQNAAIE